MDCSLKKTDPTGAGDALTRSLTFVTDLPKNSGVTNAVGLVAAQIQTNWVLKPMLQKFDLVF